jgi:signal transduction histidine kinase
VTLRTRLALLVGALVAITVVLVTLTVSAGARQSFAALDAERSNAAIAQFRREFTSEGENVVRRVERLAASDAVRRLAADVDAAGRDYAAFVDEAAPLAAAEGLDFLDVVAADDTVISSAHWPARFGYRSAWTVRAAETRTAFFQPVDVPQDTALGLVAVRAVQARGTTLYLAGGRQMNRRFLSALTLPPGMRAWLYRNVQPEVSRRWLVDTDAIDDAAALEPLIARVRDTGREAGETVSRHDGPETVQAIPLPGRDRTLAGVLLVGSSGREQAALVRRIRWIGALFGGVGIALGFVLSFVVAARVTRPVEQLAEAAREIAGGRWDVPVDGIRAPGEIGALATAFGTMSRQLVDQRERLVQAERVAAWRELARRLAHELKNPLFPLRVTLDNLRRAKPLPPPEFDEVFDESVDMLTRGIGNLNTVVGRFSDFAKMPEPDLSAVSPNTLAEESLALFRAQLSAPGAPPIETALDLDPAAGHVRADGEQLARSLQNLILNAIDAMPSGGRLSIRTRRTGDTVRIDVSDSGQGLTEEERSRLFTPYYTTKAHGTGLGLAIVQSVVADHHGKIWVDSAPGQGATFHIELPAGDPA